NNDRVFNNSTLGGGVQELNQDTLVSRSGLSKRTWTGATIDVSTSQQYDANNRAANRFPSYWESLVETGIRQPLLQGGGIRFNRIAGPNARPGFRFSNGILIAQLNDQISDADFQIAMRRFVRDLYSAYWNLAASYESYRSLEEATDLAYRTWQSVLAKREAELEGGEAFKEAQARSRYHRLKRRLSGALDGPKDSSGLYGAERELRRLMGLPLAPGVLNSLEHTAEFASMNDCEPAVYVLLRPSDKPPLSEWVFDFDDLVARGTAHRVELQRQAVKIHQQQLRLSAARNFMLPQLDLIGRYRVRGFGDDLTGGGPGFNSAADDLFSFDHQEWEFGLEMGVAPGRRQARAAVRNAALQLQRDREVMEELQRELRYAISEAQAEVSSAYDAISISQAQVEASRQRLSSSISLYEAGKIRLEFLLDAQEELVDAETQLAEDHSRHAIALIRVNEATGTLLNDIGIHVAQ
ncbi:MAG: TolC family protein, partial [Planctomycetota bacterium]